MEEPRKPRLLLVDGNSLANRAFYALPPLSTSQGVQTGAVFGFLTMLFRFIQEKRPTHIAVAFDHPSPTFRHVQYTDYKKTRKPSPAEFREQIPILKNVLEALDLQFIEMPGYEADDIIGTMAQRAEESGFRVLILSGDRDCLQLVDHHVEAIVPVRGITQVREYTPESVKSDLGLEPCQVVDYKALAGDSSDDIPGVMGIGEKTARGLLDKYRDLDEIYRCLDEISPKRTQNLLREGRDTAYLSRCLATIKKDVPLDIAVENLRWYGPNVDKAQAKFTELEFHTLIPRLAGLAGSGESRELSGDPVEPHVEHSRHGSAHLGEQRPEQKFRLVQTSEDLDQLVRDVLKSGRMSIYADVSRVAKDFKWPNVIGVATGGTYATGTAGRVMVGSADGTACGNAHGLANGSAAGSDGYEYGSADGSRVDSAHGIADCSADGTARNHVISYLVKSPDLHSPLAPLGGSSEAWQETLWRHFQPLLVNPEVEKVGFDLKWLFALCFKRGVNLEGPYFDVLVASYLMDPTRSTYRLSEVAGKYEITVPAEGSGNVESESTSDVSEHFALGAASCFAVSQCLKQDLEQAGLLALSEQVEQPLVQVLAAMEAVGVGVDLPLGRSIRQEYGMALVDLQKAIYGIAGEEFNLGSPRQLSRILFDKLGLKPVKKTKTGYSTDAEVLEALSLEHDLPNRILEYRHYAKLKSTYLDVLEDVVNPTTGRIHSTFHQTVTATGRLSSSEPNLQNIPVRGELGRALRRIFIPAKGRLFMAADYSQIELRIMAHVSRDPSMIDAFTKGEDIHARTASEMFGVPFDQVDSDLRSKAKAVNFGVIYGISDFGLARNTGVSREEARKFIDTYFSRYPKVREYMDASIERARKTGYAVTIMGRRRPIPEINSRLRQKRGFAERIAINTPIQGSAADIIKLAMVKIYQRLKDEELISRLILQVHDELIFEVPVSEEAHMRELVTHEMENVITLDVPLKVDLAVGKSWYDV
ncbi:MAG: DNA polymerase I [Bacillota bacterium]|jgi:DNA polymerase-1